MATALTHAALAPLVARLGGMQAVEALTYPVLREIMTFPGSVVAVDKLFFEIKLPKVINGYQVYDRFMQYSYSVTYDGSQAPLYVLGGFEATLNEMVFGRDPQDAVFMASVPPGSVFYIKYTMDMGGREYERTLLGVVSPVDGIKVRRAEPTHASVRRL